MYLNINIKFRGVKQMKPVIVMTQTSNIQSDLVEIVHKPFIQIQPLEIDTRLLQNNYDWLIFTSKNAVRLFQPYMDTLQVKHIAVIGSKTAQLCHDINIKVDFVPEDYSQEGLLNNLSIKGQKVLIPSSAQARPKLQQQLAINNNVVKIDLYKPVPHKNNIYDVLNMINNNAIEALTFSSSSAVRYYFNEGLPSDFNQYYAIGQQTANTLREYGIEPYIADKQTAEALINKIIESRNK